MVIKTIDLLEL